MLSAGFDQIVTSLHGQALKNEYIIEKFSLLKYFLNPTTKEFNQKVTPFSGIVLPQLFR